MFIDQRSTADKNMQKELLSNMIGHLVSHRRRLTEQNFCLIDVYLLTGIEGLLRLGVAGAEGAVQLEVVHVVEEGAGDGPKHVLQKKTELKSCKTRNLLLNSLPCPENNVHILFSP